MKNNVVISPVDMQERSDLGIKAGDTVRVWLKIEEKGKTRLQAFEGLVLARKHGAEAGGTFTVRKVSGGVGVEKILPLYSPTIDKIEIVKRAKVRRAKLYLLRGKVAREVKRILRRTTAVSISTKGSAELEEERKAAEAEEAARQEAEAKAAEEAAQTEEATAEVTEETTETPEEADTPTEEEAQDEAPAEEQPEEEDLSAQAEKKDEA